MSRCFSREPVTTSRLQLGPGYTPIANWVQAGGGWVPHQSAVAGGFDVSGETIYVGRALESGDVIPGKIVPSHGVCYVPYGGRENPHREYQALVANPGCELVWVRTSGGSLPTGAVQGGVTGSGEPLYIGRHEHGGSWVVGKVQPSHGVLYIAFGGDEIPFNDYEILCIKSVNL